MKLSQYLLEPSISLETVRYIARNNICRRKVCECVASDDEKAFCRCWNYKKAIEASCESVEKPDKEMVLRGYKYAAELSEPCREEYKKFFKLTDKEEI